MVGIGDADVGGGPGGDIGDHVVVDLSIVCIQPQVYRDIGIQGLEILNGLFVNVRLTLVGVILAQKVISYVFVSSKVSGGWKASVSLEPWQPARKTEQAAPRKRGKSRFHRIILSFLLSIRLP